MVSRDITIQYIKGLHARPAALFVQKADSYKSSIWIEKDEEWRVNAKSLVSVLALGITQGTTITLIADGIDEEAAIDGLCAWFEDGFAD